MHIPREELVELRDLALENSRFMGKRHHLGRISLGRSTAMWRGGEGGDVKLSDEGLRVGEFAPFTQRPTVLDISKYHEESQALEIIAFEMDIDSELVDIVRKLVTHESPWKDLIRADMRKSQEEKLGLHSLANDDWELLREELERGASGAYALKDILI